LETEVGSLEEGNAGRQAADRLADDWENRDWVPASPSEAWARAAVVRFGEIMAEERPIFRASMKRADKGASTLSPRPFQGILECLQNADDLNATSLRVAYRHRGRPELLIVHDGDCVTFANVGAMLLPWLSTKEHDAGASGRFGIGQRTLNALGGPITLHAAPFHLIMGSEGPETCEPEVDVPGIYESARRDTMLVIPLSLKITSEKIAEAISELGVESLLFLKSIRELSYSNLEDPSLDLRFAVEVERVDEREIDFGSITAGVLIDDVRIVAGSGDAECSTFRRYSTERPVPSGEGRANKETGRTTTLGLCAPLSLGKPCGLYDRMPLPISTGLSIGLNAQFDPDAARSTLMPNEWNVARLKDLGCLVVWAALDAFARDTSIGWNHVPLEVEVNESENWVDATIREQIVNSTQAALRETLEIQVDNDLVSLERLAFEAEVLEPLLKAEDLEAVAPDFVALPRNARDPAGRWRSVLEELGGPEEIDVDKALIVIDGNPERGIEWYLAFAAVAEHENLLQNFLSRPSVLLADGTTTVGPSAHEPWVLVKEASPTALATQLGIVRRIHAAYLVPNAPSSGFVAALEESGRLFENRDDPGNVFDIICKGISSNKDTAPIRLEDPILLALRDAWADLPSERRLEVGPRIGQRVALRSIWFDEDSKRHMGWDRPSNLYLPAAIDREVDSFAKAAGRTPELRWADPKYATILKQSKGRAAIGAQKLLSAWGVAREPRLIPPKDEIIYYNSDPTLASPVESHMRTAGHLASIKSVGANYSYLIDDRWSPDADAVVENIAFGPVKLGRKRGLALLGALSRGWEKRYAEHSTAYTAWPYYSWSRGSEVAATWLARLSEQKWFPDAGNSLQYPSDLQLQVPGSPPRPSERSSTITKVDPQILRSGVLKALGVKAGPSQSDLISRLRTLRKATLTSAVREEVLAAYQLLAASLREESGSAHDQTLPQSKLRNAFRAGPDEMGLLLVDGEWVSPESVLRGPPVLGGRRSFAPHIDGLDSLWKVLGINLPSAIDAIAVLKEIALGAPSHTDLGIAIRAFSILSDEIGDITAQRRASLSRLPLWTGTAWVTERPMYALEGEGLLESAPNDLPVWRPGLTSFTFLAALLKPLGVTRLTPSDFQIASLPTYGFAEGAALQVTYASAIALLRQEFVKADQKLVDGLMIDWDELLSAPVSVDPELSITAQLDKGPVTLLARAHMALDPLCLVVRSPADAASAAGTGAAIASLFDGDRQKVAWAWAAMWARASAGEQAEGAVLPNTRAERGKASDRLSQLGQQVAKRRSSKKPPSQPTAKPHTKPLAVQVRKLRDISALRPSFGTIVNEGAAPTGNPIVAKRSGRKKQREFSKGQNRSEETNKPRSVLPPSNDREKVALEAVRCALALDIDQLNDLRATRGVGIDAIDELRQCYEIKMCSGATMPTDVTLTAAEIEAARDDPDFFLAIVAGLEEGQGKLIVRFIFDPLGQLDIRFRSDLTLTGVDRAEALEFEFHKTEEVEVVSNQDFGKD
jgi:hypothetical protein